MCNVMYAFFFKGGKRLQVGPEEDALDVAVVKMVVLVLLLSVSIVFSGNI